MSIYTLTKDASTGIVATVRPAEYDHVRELGNVFQPDLDDWEDLYKEYLVRFGKFIVPARLSLHDGKHVTFLCADVAQDCHRVIVTQYLETHGWEFCGHIFSSPNAAKRYF